MERTESGPDPLDVKELIRQAEAGKKNWRLPKCHSESSRPEVKNWQQLMEERPVKPSRYD
jgi:hypothetical protein